MAQSAEIDQATLRKLLGAAVSTLSNYSIGFVLPTAANGLLDASLGGSGTLVTIDDFQGILTANHVIELLRKNEDVGLILPTAHKELQHISFKSSDFSQLSFCPNGEPVNGPDLGVLVPPPDVLSTLRARKSFYNLSKRQVEMLETPKPVEYGLWVLSGFPGELTSDGAAQQGFAKVKLFKGMHMLGKLTREFNEGDFDYVLFEVLYNEHYEGPNSYGGLSGGGLWQLIVQPDGSKLQVTETLLSGVAFYEFAKKDDGSGRITRDIKCHARRSLYKALIDKVRMPRS